MSVFALRDAYPDGTKDKRAAKRTARAVKTPVKRPPSPAEIHRGTALAADEAIVWRGRPRFWPVARDVFHYRGVTAYFALLFALDAFQSWHKHLPVAKALHDTVPLVAITVVALGILAGLAFLTSRSTDYVVTSKRVILNYGLALPATLSLPYSKIGRAAVSINKDHTGDVALLLKAGNHMPYLKLWPLARAWHVTHPQPMLRCVPRAAFVGGLLTRALQAAEVDGDAYADERGRPAEAETVAADRPADAERLSA